MTANEQPVKPAMTDAETEAMIKAYLLRKIEPVKARISNCGTITVGALMHYWTSLGGVPVVSFCCNAGDSYSGSHDSLTDATAYILSGASDVTKAKKLREDAANMLARAEQIEAAAMEGEVAK